eukprot:CAMPEP_0197021680 /NCGR_PEP_ID=MMETSP1384-20130603/2627_1 /TAXON_ID=29189 /ORGANISM="Ammonia sp." /LENGTH=1130 /DNA_ID=CAMNT_0042449567 /DNA_START=117 /DNA_END=3509 /DNA_ORIENTATION=-
MDLSRPRIIDLYMKLGHAITSHRSLLSTDEHATNGDTHVEDTNGGEDIPHTDDPTCHATGHTEDHDIEEAFQHIYFVMLFMACLWFVGKFFSRIGLPSLVGEILCGIILGPNLLNLVPYSDALIVIGEIGLVLLVLEAGIDVSIGHLKVVGSRGLAVAVFGSMVPLGIGTGLAIAYGQAFQSAIAIGACLAPTSMGIALNVLRNGKVLNTPTGQLIIAAAVLDDVIALMLLSELEAMADPTVKAILLPLIISPLFILFFGFLAIKCTPWLIQKIMVKTNKHQHENVILLLLFAATFAMLPICFYAGSSHLLGAFLAGLMFCTDHTIHEAWNNQIKRIMQWMLRVFFACTIGFAVPIQDFWSKPVIIGGLLYFVAIIGKILTGIFAKPLTVTEFFTIAFSMSAWGEFAFILATASYSTGTMDKDSYSSVLMAVLLSVVISPLCLRMTLSLSRKAKQKYLTEVRDVHSEYNDEYDENHPVYFCIHTKGKGKWGHQDKLLHCIFELNLEIVDFRAFNEAEYNYSHHLPIVQDVFYVLDKTLSLPPTKRLGKLDEKKLQQRYKEIKRSLKETMGDPHTSVDVMRWLPGVRRNDDIQSPVKGAGDAAAGETKKKKKRTATYCRKAAYRQARLALDNEAARSSSYLVSGISRIRTNHDAMNRDKFTYHGGIHTEQDDLIAMAFIDTLTSLQESLSPANRSSPTGSNDKEPLNTDELFAKINTLRNCVEHLQIFQPALSDDGRRAITPRGVGTLTGFSGELSGNAPSIHSIIESYQPLQHPNISAESLRSVTNTKDIREKADGGDHDENKSADGDENGKKRALRAEHGSIGTIHSKHRVHPLEPLPPRSNMVHSHSMPSMGKLSFNSLSHDKFPRDPYHSHQAAPHANSNTKSSEHPLNHSGTEGSSDGSDDLHCDTIYGDEDEHHRPLGLYTNLDDLEEEEYDDNEEDAANMKPSQSLNSLHSASNGEGGKNKNKKDGVKRTITWSKLNTMFKPKQKLSDEESEHSVKKTKRKSRRSKRSQSGHSDGNISDASSTMGNGSHFHLDDDDVLNADPKMLEIPDGLRRKENHSTKQKQASPQSEKLKDEPKRSKSMRFGSSMRGHRKVPSESSLHNSTLDEGEYDEQEILPLKTQRSGH